MIKRVYLIFFITPAFLIISSFQNCSQQPAVLFEIPSLRDLNSSKVSLRTSICPEVSFLDDEHNNFLFIMDMSMSNIGGFDYGYRDFGIYGRRKVGYWNPGKAKDANGQRFEAVRSFIDSCANSANNKFAVIGFSTGAGQVQYDTIGRPYLTCSDPVVGFGKRSDAVGNLDALKAAQEVEMAHYSPFVYPNYYNVPVDKRSVALVRTSYSKAAKCVGRMIFKDLMDSFDEDVDNYHVVFISDGRPRDLDICGELTGQAKANCYVENPSCEQFTGQQQDDCYIRGATEPFKSSIHDIGSIHRRMSILPVGYGLTEQGDYRFLNELARITRDNGQAQRLDSFENNTDVLCDLISSQFGVETNSDSLMSVVLSLTQRNGLYQSDSDMDGLSDKDEEVLGYDPVNPRSQVSGVLDGLCEKIGGIADCNLAAEKISCEANLLRSDGFSDCDVKIIKNHWQQLNLDDSSDWDRDGAPNFVEIVKGTDPFIDDMSDDPDNDGLSTRFEIMRSTNPFEHKNFSPPGLPRILIENEFSAAITPQCPRRVRHLILKEVPFIESQTVNVGMSTELLHGENEHIVAVFSSRKPQNYLNPGQGIMIGKYVKLNAVQQNNQWVLVPSITELTNNDLELWDQQ